MVNDLFEFLEFLNFINGNIPKIRERQGAHGRVQAGQGGEPHDEAQVDGPPGGERHLQDEGACQAQIGLRETGDGGSPHRDEGEGWSPPEL